MVEVQHAAESLSAHDAAAVGGIVVDRRDELVSQPLVRAFSMTVRDILENNLPQVALAQRDDACETLAAY